MVFKKVSESQSGKPKGQDDSTIEGTKETLERTAYGIGV
jgi:hypothetical protein